jgi:hypothetical protein
LTGGGVSEDSGPAGGLSFHSPSPAPGPQGSLFILESCGYGPQGLECVTEYLRGPMCDCVCACVRGWAGAAWQGCSCSLGPSIRALSPSGSGKSQKNPIAGGRDWLYSAREVLGHSRPPGPPKEVSLGRGYVAPIHLPIGPHPLKEAPGSQQKLLRRGNGETDKRRKKGEESIQGTWIPTALPATSLRLGEEGAPQHQDGTQGWRKWRDSHPQAGHSELS